MEPEIVGSYCRIRLVHEVDHIITYFDGRPDEYALGKSCYEIDALVAVLGDVDEVVVDKFRKEWCECQKVKTEFLNLV